MYAPIIVFVYNRADHAQKTLSSLAANYLAPESELFIYCDNAKSDSAAKAVESVRAFVDDFKRSSPFKSTTVIKAEHNKGLARSIIEGVTDVIKKYGRVIVVEDDLVSSPDFLTYMNSALDFYKDNQRVWSISGYTLPLKSLTKYPHDIYISPRGCSWGWATWKDRFEKVDWEVSDFDEFIKNRRKVKHFNEGGPDMTEMLTRQVNGRINSWAIRWCYAQSMADMYTVYPVKSRIRNIGCDDSGSNCVSSNLYDTQLIQGSDSCTFENLTPDRKIMREFRSMFDYSHLGKIRRKLIKLIS